MPLFVLYTAAFGSKYVTVEDQGVNTKEDLARDLERSQVSLNALLRTSSRADEHVMFDVGGDIIEFADKGRDSNLLWTTLCTFAKMGADSPTLTVVILGTGVDAKTLPPSSRIDSRIRCSKTQWRLECLLCLHFQNAKQGARTYLKKQR